MTRRANEIEIDVDPSDEDFFPSGQPFIEYESDLQDSSTRLSKRRGKATVKQQPAARIQELGFVSQPEGSDILDVKTFAFQKYAGSGIPIYLHDSGINLAHESFNGPGPGGVELGTIKWLYPKMTDALRAKYSENDLKPQGDSTGHGTCAADKIVGRGFGVAKGANLTVVPWININDDDVMIAGLEAIVHDIRKGRQSHPDGYFPVLNLSYGIGTDSTDDKDTLSRYRTVFKQLVDLDTIIVMSALNLDFPGWKTDDAYPVLFKNDDELKDNILVVGAVDVDGSEWILGQQSSLIQVWAPARNLWRGGIVCAKKTGKTDLVYYQEGTSFAAPVVAAVAAYLLSVYPELRTPGSAARKVIKRILDLSYPRKPGFRNAVWNGEMGIVEQC